jgi:hypothetical protein
VLAVHVDYEKRLATIGTQHDISVPREQILESLKGIGYRGEFVE